MTDIRLGAAVSSAALRGRSGDHHAPPTTVMTAAATLSQRHGRAAGRERAPSMRAKSRAGHAPPRAPTGPERR